MTFNFRAPKAQRSSRTSESGSLFDFPDLPSGSALEPTESKDLPIAGFSGPYRFLSNFWPARVELDGVFYPSTENAYQAAKTYPHLRAAFVTATSGQAKRLGRTNPMRPDWDHIKLAVMTDLTAQKYAPGTALAAQLLATGNAELIESNTWGDVFWGVCNGRGQNHLGKILMAQRAYLRELLDKTQELAAQKTISAAPRP